MAIPQGIGYRAKSRRLRVLHVAVPAVVWRLVPWLARRVYDLRADERFVEYPFAHAAIGSGRKLRVLDIGCWGSTFPIELAALGHEVYGLDVQEYPLEHPGFTFEQGDICDMPFADGFFDVVTAISTVEHVGLGRYDDPLYADGDRRAMDEVYRVLKPGGRVVFAVPFGERGVYAEGGIYLHRVYDAATLHRLLDRFQIIEECYSVNRDGRWRETPVAEAESQGKVARDVDAIALWVVKKPDREKGR